MTEIRTWSSRSGIALELEQKKEKLLSASSEKMLLAQILDRNTDKKIMLLESVLAQSQTKSVRV